MLPNFVTRDPVIDGQDVVIAISQSGETADTLAAVELAKAAEHLYMVFAMLSGLLFPVPLTPVRIST